MPGPLAGITVIDQTQALAGPYCSMMLGDMGADVIKIERPGVGDNSRQWGPPFIGSESAYYLSVNRNKRSLSLDITTAAGQEILRQLLAGADVYITNIPRVESMQKYGIDYERVHALNPRLVYLAISGFGHTGPRAGQAGYDLAMQGESGTMYVTGERERAPMRFPTPMADLTTGIFALSAILGALHARHTSGEGQFIDVSLLESQMTWLQNYAGEYFATGEDPPSRGNNHPQVVPYEPMETADGQWIILGVASDNTWRKLCDVCGDAALAALRDDPAYATNAARVQNRATLLPIVRATLRARTAAEWIGLLKAAGVPAGPIRSIKQAFDDPHVLERGTIVEIDHPQIGAIRSIATPIHYSATPLEQARLHPPLQGEHNDEILRALNYTPEQVANLRAQGVIE